MKDKISWNSNFLLLMILVICVFMATCANSEENKQKTQLPAVGDNQAPSTLPAGNTKPAKVSKTKTADIAVSVNGHILKKSTLEKELTERMNTFENKISVDKIKEMRENMKKQMVEEFIMRSLISDEVKKRKIEITDKEMQNTLDQIKTNLPPDKNLETFMKENKITKKEIALSIKLKKMVAQDLGTKGKPSQKEISKFYEDNKDKFIVPENINVRHILIAFKEGDDDKIKAEKKKKIEDLRKQILEGADFAEVAANNSDCPSKERGGNLGQIRRDQTVKPFEDAAFSQERNVVGPVVTTDFGYHIIQVLEHNQPKEISLDDMKEKIANHLEQQKQTETFNALLKKLEENAKIVQYEN
jgi:peptidyl-prolyl cis-trans isomerase C